jgi:hypothetical protein
MVYASCDKNGRKVYKKNGKQKKENNTKNYIQVYKRLVF